MEASVILSIVRYGAAIWADALAKDRRLREDVGYLMRRVALRVISAYRTMSHISIRGDPVRRTLWLDVIGGRILGSDASGRSLH